MSERNVNKLIIVGNGFDLAHGLPTSYKNFLDWYICDSFASFCTGKSYSDPLISFENRQPGMIDTYKINPRTFSEVLSLFGANSFKRLEYNSKFFQSVINSFENKKWVDLECAYFNRLKLLFANNNSDAHTNVQTLNTQFDFLVKKLSEYISIVNKKISEVPKLENNDTPQEFRTLFQTGPSDLLVLNFNYTDTLSAKEYCSPDAVIHIHGRVADIEANPIIFGYGDESDPSYQSIEDSGDNVFLQHIKSFGYFKTKNFQKLITYLDTTPYEVFILGHSCGLSDRVLLREIFEHQNCNKIKIFFHRSAFQKDNFTEITQQISRHFSPQHKQLMRRRVEGQNHNQFIPQNT